MKPTAKDLAALKTIIAFIQANGYPPTIREIGKTMGTEVSTTATRLHRLEDLGWIERNPRIARGLRTTQKGEMAAT